jgi:LmbE family N-acetylglucosaminyl deacetylase
MNLQLLCKDIPIKTSCSSEILNSKDFYGNVEQISNGLWIMKILAIGAHFDDVEIGCAGTLLKHKKHGDDIHILIGTDSGYENKSKQHVRSAEDALAEGRESARRLGAELHVMGLPTATLTPTESLVLALYEYIEAIHPDRIYTHRPGDTNCDHSAVGHTSLRAGRRCKDLFLYRSNWFIIDDQGSDNFFVDISMYMQKKLELINIFQSELRQAKNDWIDFVTKQNQSSGYKIGVEYAETFQIIKYVW